MYSSSSSIVYCLLICSKDER
ncbi:hypothetical protein DFA_08233 [Cavenderia fasciculata]|uniref:Uncharacterized protein n=1 Tax=Cavenderia fasciculata TaxID=261658 RepID=F4Q5I4_CACFS|nr:hypothetical protein DFA_08233 [Cavenderia fasciculata]EGG17243.1 hypothetical protein DFA_08233 [Cavenderia fasciculata]|eukprot:XP_004355727.1 hypothetical protein DFA_08233 [Cavenderia fasciculata]